ncbi:MAG: pyruvate ferredoxin oxidoreductase [Proteobacteria bacterium]|nr:pyruvate ferredoxin oxidoreductase [Pseudomonadota bacterium]
MLKVITGNEAAAYGALLCRPKIVCAYPITPQSRIPELLSEFHAEGLLKGEFINVESEMSALSYVIGAAQAGARVFTATSSQGLAWMHEGLHWAVGARLPIVLVNVNRPLAPPWNLTCEHTDSLSQRDTGWLQFYCESNQEILDTVIQAYKIAESVTLPCMVCLDGVYLSYFAESVDIPDQSKVDEYLPPFETTLAYDNRFRMFRRTPAEPLDYEQYDYMTNRYQLHKLENTCIDTALHSNEEFKLHFGRGYDPVEEYKCEDAEVVVLMSGSAVGTCRYVIDMLRDDGYRVGLVKLKMFRPFPKELVRKALHGREKIAVIDRDLSPGEGGIIYQEVKGALNINTRNHTTPVYGFISGLGGADISVELIKKAILYMIKEDPPEDEVIWLGKIKNVRADQDENTINIS